MGESGRKGKEAGELKASCQKETLLMKEIKKNGSSTVLVWGDFYSQPLIQNTKKKNKSKSYYRGQNMKKTKK